MQLAGKKRAGGGQENKLGEIVKPRGFDRMLPLESIVGTTDHNRVLMFLVKWAECDEYDLLPVSLVNLKEPNAVIAYYEKRSKINQKCKERNQILEQIEQKLEENPSTEEESPQVEEPVVSSLTEPMEVGADDDVVEAAQKDVSIENNVDSNESAVVEESTHDSVDDQTQESVEEPSQSSMEEPTQESVETTLVKEDSSGAVSDEPTHPEDNSITEPIDVLPENIEIPEENF